MSNVSTFRSTFLRLAATGITVAAVSLAAAGPAAAQAAPKRKAVKPAGPSIMLMQPMAAKTGDNQFEVMVEGADGKPIADADVSVLLVMPAMPAMKMAEMRNEVKLTSAGAGKYTGSGSVMTSGKWNVTISVKQAGKEIGQKKTTLNAK